MWHTRRKKEKRNLLTLTHFVNTVAGALLLSIWISGSALGSASGAPNATFEASARMARVSDFIIFRRCVARVKGD